MARYPNYPKQPFSPSQNFLARDPAGSGQVIRVQGQSMLDHAVEDLKSRGEIVQAVDTLDEAKQNDYSSGTYILTGGSSLVLDGQQAIYRVSDPGSGGIAMDNGNELVILFVANTPGEFVAAIDSVADISTIDLSIYPDRSIFYVTGYHPGSTVGGGTFVFGTGTHDGVNCFDPLRAFPTDWTDEAQKAAWYDKTGGVVDCWIRTKKNNGEVEVYAAGAKYDGTTDDTKAHQAAIGSLTEGGAVFLGIGTTILTDMLQDDINSPTTVGKTITLVGYGSNEDPVNSGEVTILKFIGGSGIKFDGNRSGGRDFVVEGDGGVNSGGQDNIIVDASRAQWKNIVSKKARGDGFRFRFGNSSSFENILCLQNKENGFNADGTGYIDKNGVSKPNDLNACTFINIDARANGGVGFRTGINSSFSNWCYGLTPQGNGGVGAEFNGDYYRVFGFYGENNDAAGDGLDVLFTSTADNNYIWGVFSNNELSALDFWRDDSVNQRNYIDRLKNISTEYQVQSLLLGQNTAPNGYLNFSGEGDGTNPSITLEGSGASQQIDITSSGAGKLGINPDFITLEDSVAPVFQNGWADHGGSRKVAGYYVDKFGIVHLEGGISGGTAVNPTIMFNLPPGYRPAQRVRFSTTANGAFGSLFVDPDGNVYYESGANVEFSLDGVNFRIV